MKTVILCGGQGTRIRDVADNIPKPMISVGGYPILWHIMKIYAQAGCNDFVLCLGHKGNVIKDFFLNYDTSIQDFTIKLGKEKSILCHDLHDECDWIVTLAETGQNAMTGSRIGKIKKYIANDENFLLTYGDGLSDIDVGKLLDFHDSHGKILTVTGVRPPGRFGEILADDGGVIHEFNEKPQATGGRISGGFFVCRRELFDYLDDNEGLVFEQEPMQRLVADGELMMYRHDGFWQPMDTYRDYKMLNDLYKDNNAPWVTW